MTSTPTTPPPPDSALPGATRPHPAPTRRSARFRGVALAAATVVVGAALPPIAGASASPVAPAPLKATQKYSVTSAVEARRVDRVNARISWYRCYGSFDCATVKLPLDYDKPNGPTTEVAVLRSPATDQKHRIGSLFVNPGGPGGSGVQMASAARDFLPAAITSRFDVIGFDPRGINFSSQVKCFGSTRAQTEALDGMNVPFPKTLAEQKAYLASSVKLARACSTTGRPLTAHASTAEVARDMDVLRRGVGDKQLSYLGFSYGTYLGQVYANLFPDRVRAITIDGVLDPQLWRGTPANRHIPVTLRLNSDAGAWKALQEIFRRCDAAGPGFCPVAGNSLALYQQTAAKLAAKPLVISYDDGTSYTVTYASFVSDTLSLLYSPAAGDMVAQYLAAVVQMMAAPAPTTAARTTQQTQRIAAARTVKTLRARIVASQHSTTPAKGATTAAKSQARGYDFPYYNDLEAFSTVLCTDSLNPANPNQWPAAIASRQRTVPYFSEAWGWGSSQCATSAWTVRDEDAYTGPFTATTKNPVLVVGDYWDPATNYNGAVAASRLLGNARLLTSDSWGHTAYGTSACVTDAVDNYLLSGVLPAQGTVCTGDQQPFTTPLDQPDPGMTAAAKATVPLVRPGMLPAPRPATR